MGSKVINKNNNSNNSNKKHESNSKNEIQNKNNNNNNNQNNNNKRNNNSNNNNNNNKNNQSNANRVTDIPINNTNTNPDCKIPQNFRVNAYITEHGKSNPAPKLRGNAFCVQFHTKGICDKGIGCLYEHTDPRSVGMVDQFGTYVKKMQEKANN
jgi:hypothetical protein